MVDMVDMAVTADVDFVGLEDAEFHTMSLFFLFSFHFLITIKNVEEARQYGELFYKYSFVPFNWYFGCSSPAPILNKPFLNPSAMKKIA